MKCEMAIIDHTGDTKLIWDPDNNAEVEAAREMFNSLRKKGHVAYKVDRKGDKGEIITEFDKDAEKIILAPPVRGG